MSQVSAVRNPEGYWINSQVFREDTLHFHKYGYYTADPWGSPGWYEYWEEQRRRMINGHTIGGVTITGDHYFYLNFTQMQKTIGGRGKKKGRKVKGPPDFWDGDYNYFWAREIAKNGILEGLGYKESRIISLQENDEEIYHNLMKEEFDKLNLSLSLDAEDMVGGYNLLVGKSRRKGYQQPHSEVVMTPEGKSTMGKIQVGDEVLTPTGSAKVLKKYPQGVCDVYEVTLFDGRKIECGLEHLWKVYGCTDRKDYRQERVVDTEFLLNTPLKVGVKYKWFLPTNDEVEYPTKELPIPAYTLGALLGDGNITKQLKLSGIDEEILNRVLSELNSLYVGSEGYSVGSTYEANWGLVFQTDRLDYWKEKYGISKFANAVNPIYKELEKLKLNVKSEFKYIPEIYKNGDRDQRIALVKGMMDTDGTIGKDGACTFGNKSEQLVLDLKEVLHSLGVNSTFRKRKDGLFIIYINTNKNVFYISRKSNRVRPERKTRKYIPIVSVKKLDKREESSCILIDSEDHLYLTRNYVVTHNSYKNAGIAARNYFTKPNSYTALVAYEKKYLVPKGLFTMCRAAIDFVNINTAFTTPSDKVDQNVHIRASFTKETRGVKGEHGLMSEVQALTAKDNADVMRGKDAEDIFIEESGAFGTPGLLQSMYAAAEDCVRDGDVKTGMITVFGTSGNLEAGAADYADMFVRPEAFGCLAFHNIWDNDGSTCSFFHSAAMNMVGHYDEQGNSHVESATAREEEIRANLMAKGATATQIKMRQVENPLRPSEAFYSISNNIFPTEQLNKQLQKVKSLEWQTKKGTPVKLIYDGNEVIAKPLLGVSAQPITSYKQVNQSGLSGCVVIYEHPIGGAPRGLYKIGYDPVRHDEGTSLAGIVVYKGVMMGSMYHSIPVAEYIGRLPSTDDIDEVSLMLAILYNTEVMYENEVPGVKNYYRRKKQLGRLASQPDAVISKNVKNSKVTRVYGCHMNEPLKDAGERYVKDWLLTVLDYDEDGNPILVIDKIYSIRMLEELISYSRKGNFDLVSALFMCMFQVQEEVLDKQYGKKEPKANVKKLKAMMLKMYKK